MNELVQQLLDLKVRLNRWSKWWLASDLVSNAAFTIQAQQARIAELEKELALCEPFLKENETPAMCIARNRTDVDIALGLYASELKNREKLEAGIKALQLAFDTLLDNSMAENQRLREALKAIESGDLYHPEKTARKALLGGGEK